MEVLSMSNKEIAIKLINELPDYKIGYAVAYLQGLIDDEKATADDIVAIQEAHK
jgi:hypothetical protein